MKSQDSNAIKKEANAWVRKATGHIDGITNRTKCGSREMMAIFIRSYCKAFPTTYTRLIADRIAAKDDRAVINAQIHPDEYDTLVRFSPLPFMVDWTLAHLVKNFPHWGVGLDLERVALESFRESEINCAATNHRLSSSLKLSKDLKRDWHETIISIAARKIDDCLGEVDYDLLSQECRWGPGSTLTLMGGSATLDNKIREKRISSTASNWKFYSNAVACDLHLLWARGIPAEGPTCLVKDEFVIKNYSHYTSVPKNAKTNRNICIEPSANMFTQLGIGALIRKKLLSKGVNLNDQTINQDWARQAGLLGLATLDLRAASDSISQVLVERLLPPRWLTLLSLARTDSYYFKDDLYEILHKRRKHSLKYIHKFNKWSSMGNGYTFELESLIFWAIAAAVMESKQLCPIKPDLFGGWARADGVLSVYGDDIIINSCYVPDLIEVFSYIGFEINISKSFVSGRFYESCGKHYYDGGDVTPIYQREGLSSLSSVIRLHNRFIRYARRFVTRNREHDIDYAIQFDPKDYKNYPDWAACASVVDKLRSLCGSPIPAYFYNTVDDESDVSFLHMFETRETESVLYLSDKTGPCKDIAVRYGVTVPKKSIWLIDGAGMYAYSLRCKRHPLALNPPGGDSELLFGTYNLLYEAWLSILLSQGKDVSDPLIVNSTIENGNGCSLSEEVLRPGFPDGKVGFEDKIIVYRRVASRFISVK